MKGKDNMTRVIISPQKSDMGYGCGEILTEDATLKEFFDYFKKETNAWGTMTIYYPSGEIVRKFDYELYNSNIFYCNIDGWIMKYKVDKAVFKYCFMSEDYEVYLKK